MASAVVHKPRVVENDQQRLDILNHLLDGRTVEQTADIISLHRTQVTMVASAHGWPDRQHTEWSRDLLVERLEHPEKHATPAPVVKPAAAKPTPVKRAAPAPRTPEPVQTPVVPVVSNPRPSIPGSMSNLVERGHASSWASTRRRTEEFVAALRALRAALEADERYREVVR